MGTKSQWMRSLAALCTIAAAVGFTTTASAVEGEKADGDVAKEVAKADQAKRQRPKIQMAILLDTSGSMRGLINQARSQLWKVVNEFAAAKRNGQQPLLEVALYEYGHASLGAESGFMRRIVPLTDDLDKISEELFKLETGGSREYCGMVIDLAVEQLKWSQGRGDLRCIFIAGNEPFTQGPVDFRKACKKAADGGITVSTIFCGPHQTGVSSMWLEASKLADGSYMSIDQNQQLVTIDAPQDKELARLNAQINTTYVTYGNKKMREEAANRQLAQDANAAKSSPTAGAARAQFKASALYNNARWDLCDAYRLGKVKLEDLKEDQLPPALKKLSLPERKAYIEKMIAERTKIQKQIKALSEARGKYVAAERKKLAVSDKETLDSAIIQTVRKQAQAKQFKFEK